MPKHIGRLDAQDRRRNSVLCSGQGHPLSTCNEAAQDASGQEGGELLPRLLRSVRVWDRRELGLEEPLKSWPVQSDPDQLLPIHDSLMNDQSQELGSRVEGGALKGLDATQLLLGSFFLVLASSQDHERRGARVQLLCLAALQGRCCHWRTSPRPLTSTTLRRSRWPLFRRLWFCFRTRPEGWQLSLMSAVSSVFACHCASSFTCRGGFVCMSHVAQLCAFIWEWDRSLEAGDKARAALFTKRASAPRLRRLDKVSGPGSRDVFLC